MRKLFTVYLLLLPCLSFADIKTELAKCAGINPDAARLSCLDKVSNTTTDNVSKGEAAKGAGKWKERIETSPIDDSKNVFLTLAAEMPVRNRREATTPALSIRCKEKQLTAYITYDFFLGSDSISVLTRNDKLPAKSANWGISTDHRAAFVGGSVAQFIRELFQSERLLVELTPFGENPVMTAFDVRGLANASKALKQNCPWKSSEKYVFQAGVFASIESAEAVLIALRGAGLPVYTETIPIKSGTAVRVRIGPYESREKAEMALEQAKKLGADGRVVPLE